MIQTLSGGRASRFYEAREERRERATKKQQQHRRRRRREVDDEISPRSVFIPHFVFPLSVLTHTQMTTNSINEKNAPARIEMELLTRH
jgi:hypothetical protein